VCFWKNCFARFFPPFFGHYICVNIKIHFSHFFSTIFFQNFTCIIRMLLEKLFSAFFPPIFWSRYSCDYKKRFSHFFPTIFFPNFFDRTIRVFLQKLFRAFISPHFLVTIFVWMFKNDLDIISDDLFPNIFWSHYSCVFGKIVSVVFFSAIFWSRYSCEYKKRFSHFF